MAVNVGNVALVYILRKFPDLLSQKTCNKNALEIAQYMQNEEMIGIIQQKMDEQKQMAYQNCRHNFVKFGRSM
jgi:hypothetical protein